MNQSKFWTKEMPREGGIYEVCINKDVEWRHLVLIKEVEVESEDESKEKAFALQVFGSTSEYTIQGYCALCKERYRKHVEETEDAEPKDHPLHWRGPVTLSDPPCDVEFGETVWVTDGDGEDAEPVKAVFCGQEMVNGKPVFWVLRYGDRFPWRVDEITTEPPVAQ